jgi:hypothetical protein
MYDIHRILRVPIAVLILLLACVFSQHSQAATTRPDATIPVAPMDLALARDWLARWNKSILAEMHNRFCDKEMGEEIGWKVSPLINGFYYGYMVTGDTTWIDRLIDWTDAVINRAVQEPDGYLGWPKVFTATGPPPAPAFNTDIELGDAMFFRPIVLMAGQINATPALKARYGNKAQSYLAFSEKMFQKWDARGAWRETSIGGLWVQPQFAFDQGNNKFSDDYQRRGIDGFSLPDNKQNAIADWLLAMSDVTGDPIYRQRAEKWFQVMKSRMRTGTVDRFVVWDYWDVGGPWDIGADGKPRLWIGVHPNGTYYAIDVQSIVNAFEHNIVFTQSDIEKLIATNRDFMWDAKLKPAGFRAISGNPANGAHGVIWSALTPYDSTLRTIFEANYSPASWAGLTETPWYIAKIRAAAAAR